MTAATLAAAPGPKPDELRELTVPYAEFDQLQRAVLATLAAFAGGYPNPLGYLRDALGDLAPRPGAHPREYLPAESEDASWGRW
jgi:hypothetical protein